MREKHSTAEALWTQVRVSFRMALWGEVLHRQIDLTRLC
jgi:hypothetical protein